MTEYIWSYYDSAGELYEYAVGTTGEVYDTLTGELIGVYDAATDAVYYAGEAVITGVSDTASGVSDVVSTVYADAKEGASAAIGTVDSLSATSDKALNIASVVLLIGVLGGGYLFLRPWLK